MLPAADIHRAAFALVDVLAELHAVDPAAVGLADFGRPEGYLRRQVARWHDQWVRVSTRPLPDVETLHSTLAASCPAESGVAIVHGDFRIDNACSTPRTSGRSGRSSTGRCRRPPWTASSRAAEELVAQLDPERQEGPVPISVRGSDQAFCGRRYKD